MDFPGRLIAAFLAVVLILLFPLQYLARTTENSIDSYIEDCTEQFSDDIRNKGYIDAATYEAYVQTLDASGELYDLEIEDIHPVTGEEVSLNEKGKETILATKSVTDSVHKDNKQNELSLSTNNLKVLGTKPILAAQNGSFDNIDISFPETKLNEELYSFAAHTHTPDCYAGHNHEASGCEKGYVCHEGSYLTISISWQHLLDTDFMFFDFKCSVCGKTIARIGRAPGMGYTTVKNYFIAASTYQTTYGTYELVNFCTETYQDNRITGDCPWGIDYYQPIHDNYFLVAQTMSYKQFYTTYPQFARTLPYGQYGSHIITTPPAMCTYANDPNPICNQVITSITPTNPVQTLKKGESIITTATATYLDGHTGIVNCSSNFNPNLSGTQIVTLIYNGLVGNAKTNGTRACTINVTMNLRTLDHISATPQTQTISRMGSPSITVTAYYSDGSSVLLSYGQYTLSPFNTSLIGGPQTITVSYTEGGIARTTSVMLYVDYVTSITVTPNEVNVDRYTESIPVIITANYRYSGSKVLTGGVSVGGYSPVVIGDQTVTFYYTEGGITVSANAVVHVLPLSIICPVCGKLFYMNADDTDTGCPYCKDVITGIEVSPTEVEVTRGSELPITVMATYKDGSVRAISGWNSSFVPDQTGFQVVTVQYGGFEASLNVMVKETEVTCPICGKSYPINEGSCPICREKVVSISVLPDALTIEQYGSIELEVIATYADGSKKQVTDWSIDCTTANPGVYSATVSYQNKMASLTLTVLSQFMITCPYCKIPYDSGEHPEGCPDCFKTITGIEAFSATGTDMVQLGTLPDISVVLIFKDTHREITKDGYTIEGFQVNQLGEQTATVKYKKFSCTLTLKVVNAANGIVCPKGHIYYPDEDGKDTGCPFCVLEEEHPTIVYYDITYLSQILDVVYTDGLYRFDSGNYLMVRTTKRNLSLVSKIQKLFFKLTLLGRKRRFTYGGEVL